MRFPRRSGDVEADSRHDAGDGRNYRAGVSALVLAAGVVFLILMNQDHLSPWGITAAVVWLVTLFTLSLNSLSRIRNRVLTTAAQVGALIGGFVLFGWSQASPHDLIGSRMPDELSVRMRGWWFGLLLLLSLGWSVRRWIRDRRSIRAGLVPARPPGFAKTKPGYATRDVDEFLARIVALPDTAEGRIEARARIEGVEFQLSRGYGYNPHQVAQHLERLVQRYVTHAN